MIADNNVQTHRRIEKQFQNWETEYSFAAFFLAQILSFLI